MVKMFIFTPILHGWTDPYIDGDMFLVVTGLDLTEMKLKCT